MMFCLRHLDRGGARGYNERRQVNQQTVAIAFIGNAVENPQQPLSTVRMTSAQICHCPVRRMGRRA